ncbi:MAG: hypothetical protein ACLQVF_32855 [Isosphaeraceae bacterium]
MIPQSLQFKARRTLERVSGHTVRTTPLRPFWVSGRRGVEAQRVMSDYELCALDSLWVRAQEVAAG